MSDGKMSHEYLHGYYAKELQAYIDALTNKYENEQDEQQAIIDGLTLTSNAYLTSRDIVQNFREDYIRKRQRDLKIPTLEKGEGETWEWDENSLDKWWKKAANRLFGLQPDLKLIENDDAEDSDYQGIDKSTSTHQSTQKTTGNKTISPDGTEIIVKDDGSDYYDPYGIGTDSDGDTIYPDDMSDELGESTDGDLSMGFDNLDPNKDLEDDVLLSDVSSNLLGPGVIGYGTSKSGIELNIDPNDNEYKEIPKGWDNEEIEGVDGPQIAGITDTDKSAALMAVNDIKPANSFKELLEEDLLKKDKLKNIILGNIV